MAAQAVIAENGRLDWLGVLCSFGCAVHCAAMPLVLATLPTLTSLKWLADPLFHQVVAVVCGILVARAILPGYRTHRDRRVLAAAGIGLSLLFIAAFILPDACCSNLHVYDSPLSDSDKFTENRFTEKFGRLADSKSDAELPKFVLISSNGVTSGRFGSIDEQCEICESQTSQVGHPSRTELSRQERAGGSSASANRLVACELDACSHSTTYGRPLLSAVELASHVGTSGAETLIKTQPYLSPLGGLFLIAAHVLNIRLRVCGRPKCCRVGQ